MSSLEMRFAYSFRSALGYVSYLDRLVSAVQTMTHVMSASVRKVEYVASARLCGCWIGKIGMSDWAEEGAIDHHATDIACQLQQHEVVVHRLHPRGFRRRRLGVMQGESSGSRKGLIHQCRLHPGNPRATEICLRRAIQADEDIA